MIFYTKYRNGVNYLPRASTDMADTRLNVNFGKLDYLIKCEYYDFENIAPTNNSMHINFRLGRFYQALISGNVTSVDIEFDPIGAADIMVKVKKIGVNSSIDFKEYDNISRLIWIEDKETMIDDPDGSIRIFRLYYSNIDNLYYVSCSPILNKEI